MRARIFPEKSNDDSLLPHSLAANGLLRARARADCSRVKEPARAVFAVIFAARFRRRDHRIQPRGAILRRDAILRRGTPQRRR